MPPSDEPPSDEIRRSVDDLDRRVRKLENIVWVVGALGIALGAGGAGLWNALSHMRETATQLEGRVSNAQTSVSQLDERTKQLDGRAAQLETQVKNLKDLTGNVENHVQAVFASAEAASRENLAAYLKSQRAILLQGVIRDGDSVALRFAETRVYIGAAGGRGAVNTGNQGASERYKVGTEETFVIERH